MSTQSTTRADLHDALRRELLRLARREDDAASREAARVHYWEPTPVIVVVHRRCAAILRDAADERRSVRAIEVLDRPHGGPDRTAAAGSARRRTTPPG